MIMPRRFRPPQKKKSKIYSSGFYVKFMIEKLAPVPVSFTLDYDAVSSAVIDCVRAEGLQNASKFINKSHQVGCKARFLPLPLSFSKQTFRWLKEPRDSTTENRQAEKNRDPRQLHWKI